ncbi:MAG: hypothetical protein KC777_08870 [Cyanobacteria bacterium HKST-UBA02]|nr:hypothetical protein [Cyanobacteria bacterium HKST-UBA02]
MDFGENLLSKTGLFRVAKEKPVRPVTSIWLVIIGSMTILFSLLIVYAVYINNFVAAGCSAAAAILVMWCGVAFLWHSVKQLNAKISALTELVKRNNDTDSLTLH